MDVPEISLHPLTPREWQRVADFIDEGLAEGAYAESQDSPSAAVDASRLAAVAQGIRNGQPFGLTEQDVNLVQRQVNFAQRAAEADCGNAGYHQACKECQAAVDKEKVRLRDLANRLRGILGAVVVGDREAN